MKLYLSANNSKQYILYLQEKLRVIHNSFKYNLIFRNFMSSKFDNAKIQYIMYMI